MRRAATIWPSSGGRGASSQNDSNSSTTRRTDMPAKWIELVTGPLEQKKQWRAYKARVAAFPAPYRESVDAIERYLMYAGASDADNMMQMLDDLADLFDRAAADGKPVRDIVGENPVEFV